jgi:hypothetical protein
MLSVIYEAADLDNNEVSDWQESRGSLKIRVDRHATPEEFTQSLTRTFEEILTKAHWYQLWGGEIASVTSNRSPLRVAFHVSTVSPSPLVYLGERKGSVTVHVSPTATVDEFVHAINPAVAELLAGGQWFQHWQGEIVTMDSPTTALV